VNSGQSHRRRNVADAVVKTVQDLVRILRRRPATLFDAVVLSDTPTCRQEVGAPENNRETQYKKGSLDKYTKGDYSRKLHMCIALGYIYLLC